ncbi:substrate-binding periplasmic protein [Pseudodesulfovibrio karagichevae]|uniref:Substrate-binding periplasmic protein n=1 Tax=Pseudodesulfovibrio karagichevae TaxID=3239305 RepID=A0ABV4K6Z8_9BACT
MPNHPARRPPERNAALCRLWILTTALIAVCLLTPLCAGPVHAEPVELTVGVERIDYPPYGSFRQGDYEGYARDLLDSFAIEYGYTMVYVPLPVKRLYQEFLETGTLDLKFPDSPDWQQTRRKGLHIAYSAPACSYTDGILVRPENLGKGMGAIRTLGILAGFKPWLLNPPIDPKTIKVSENASISGLLGKGLVGRVDGVYANVEAARHLLSAMGRPDQLVLDPGLPHMTGYYRLSTIKRPLVMREFDRFLKTRSALVDSLRRKHGLDR